MNTYLVTGYHPDRARALAASDRVVHMMDVAGRADHVTWPGRGYDHVVDVNGLAYSRDPIGYAERLLSAADMTLWIDRHPTGQGRWHLSAAFFHQLAQRNSWVISQISYHHVQMRRVGRQPWRPPEARLLEFSDTSARARLKKLLT